MAGFENAGEFSDGARKGADYFWGKQALSVTLPAVLDAVARQTGVRRRRSHRSGLKAIGAWSCG
jgi:hypothetical protein